MALGAHGLPAPMTSLARLRGFRPDNAAGVVAAPADAARVEGVPIMPASVRRLERWRLFVAAQIARVTCPEATS